MTEPEPTRPEMPATEAPPEAETSPAEEGPGEATVSEAGERHDPAATEQPETVAREVPEGPQGSAEKERSRETAAEGPPPPPSPPPGSEVRGQNPPQTNGPHIGHADQVVFKQGRVDPAWTEPAEARLEDWLRDLPAKPPRLQPQLLEMDPTVRREAPRRPLVLVSCFDASLSLSASYALIDDLFVGYKRKYLYFKPRKEQPAFDLFDQLDSESAKHRVILVEIDREGFFFESLRASTATAFEHILSRLKSADTTLICSLGSGLLRIAGDAPVWLPSVPHWRIPYLQTRLRRFFDAEEASRLESRLDEQRRRSQWPVDDEDFFREVDHHLSSGPSELKRQVELRDGGTPSDEPAPPKPGEIFPEEGELEQNVLCAAIYFPDLAPRSFETLVLRLLGDKTTEIEEREEVRTDEGEVRVVSKKVPQRLGDLWSRAPDPVLHRCQLIAAQRPDGSPVIDFTAPHLRRELRRFVETRYPMLVSRVFRRLVDGGVLFAPDLPDDLSGALIQATVEKLLEDPSYFGDGWLVRSVIELRRRLRVDADPSDENEIQLVKLLAALRNEELWTFFCRRLADLLREMLRHPQLEEPVNALLHGLLRHRHEGAVLDIVLRLMERLRFVRSFDALAWLKILVDQSPEEGREQVIRALYRIAARSGSDILPLLDRIHDWLPEEDRPRERYSPSNRLAITFIWVYCQATAQSFELAPGGSWPSHYPLFRTLDPQDVDTRRRLEMIFSWLRRGVDGENSGRTPADIDEGALCLLGGFLERWFVILEGDDPSIEPPAEARALSDLVLEVAAESLGRYERRAIVSCFYQRQEECLNALAALPVTAREERRRLGGQRQTLMTLRRRFTEAAAGGGEPSSPRDPKGAEA